MRTIDDIRHDRLLELIHEAGSIQALADRLGKSHSQISQLKTRARRNEAGDRKTVGTALAREIEEKLGKPAGWMDTDTKACCTGGEPSVYRDQPAPQRSRQDVWRDAANHFSKVAARAGVQFDPETFMLFVDAALEQEQEEIDEATAEQVLKRWLPILARGRASGHTSP
jgi:hypothetical protein